MESAPENNPEKQLELDLKLEEKTREQILLNYFFAFEKRRTLEREKTGEGELLLCEGKKLLISFLKEGDVVIVESNVLGDPADSFVFKVTKATSELNISGSLDGGLVEEKHTEKDVHLVGSSLDGSSLIPNYIVPNIFLYFTDESGEFIMPPTIDYAIARKNDKGVLEILKPGELTKQ